MNIVEKKMSALTLEEIGTQLIQDRYLLTALELHTEAIECGKEVPSLRDYFSNPANFEWSQKSTQDVTSPPSSLNRSSSQTTLDSLDWARYSEDGEKCHEDKIAILEFELRKAQKTIQSLRDNLTQATASETGIDLSKVAGSEVAESIGTDLKPHEVSALNFLVNEYLVSRSYKMTANTFSDENDNYDFENWDDVGLNIPRPPPLNQWLRERAPNLSPKTDFFTQTDPHVCLSEELSALRIEFAGLQDKIALQNRELEELRNSRTSEVKTVQSSKDISTLLEDSHEDLAIDEEEVIEVGKNCVKYARKTSTSSNGSPRHSHFEAKEDETIEDKVSCGTLEPFEDEYEDRFSVATIEDKDLRSAIESTEIKMISGFSSIEDCIENVSSESREDIGKDTVLTSDITDHSFVQNTDDQDSEHQNLNFYDGMKFEAKTESVDDAQSSGDVLDPLKCDRLPPLGASNESSPHGLLPGEFVSAQRNEAKNLLKSTAVRNVPESLESRVFEASLGSWSEVDSRLQNDLAALSLGQGDLLTLVASSLHNIAPNVILAKREELLPLLVYSISNHSDEKERERLLHLLFNLTKRPDKEQRGAILLGLVSLARVLGPGKLEAELLPQCWEQLTHKYLERRLLVAQSVAALAPYTPVALRNSLLLSMLLQLLDTGGEKETLVREAALASLSLLVTYMEDREKLQSLVEILIACLEFGRDHQKTTIAELTNVHVFLSSLAYWCVKSECLSSIFTPLLDRKLAIALQLKESGSNLTNTALFSCLNCLVKGLNALVPFLVLTLRSSLGLGEEVSKHKSLALSSPDTLSFVDELDALLDSQGQVEGVLHSLHLQISRTDADSCPDLMYIIRVVLPKIIEVLSYIDVSNKELIISLINFFLRLNVAFGASFRDSVVSSLLRDQLDSRSGETQDALFVVYVVAILSEQSDPTKPELQPFLSSQISDIAESGRPTLALELAISLLIDKSHLLEDVLAALWAAVVHRTPTVRICSASLWVLMVGRVKENQLSSRVVPALVTLATDPEPSVRASVLSPLVYVIANTAAKEVRDKVGLQLEMVCDETQVMTSSCLQMALARTCSSLGPNMPSHILHNLFLPLLCRVSIDGQGTPEERLAFGTALLEALTALSSCLMPDHVVAHFVLPALNQLQKTVGGPSLEHMETITLLTKEYTLRAQLTPADKVRSPGSGPLGSLGSTLSHSVGAMGSGLSPGVEDMKNKMSKMGKMISGKAGGSGFSKGSPSVSIPSMFKKK